MHNLCGIPVFAGIPIAGLASATTAVRSRDYRWACYSAGSSTVMAGSLLRVGGAIRGQSRLSGKSGIFQRISIVTGLGWCRSPAISHTVDESRCATTGSADDTVAQVGDARGFEHAD
jgi:hypothetical protein